MSEFCEQMRDAMVEIYGGHTISVDDKPYRLEPYYTEREFYEGLSAQTVEAAIVIMALEVMQ